MTLIRRLAVLLEETNISEAAESMKEVQLFQLLELWNVRMPDRGASHAIVHHHNGAATGAGEARGGVLTGG